MFEETPITPAPVFAVRAFRNAIFGTPTETRDPGPVKTADTGMKGRHVDAGGSLGMDTGTDRNGHPILQRPSTHDRGGPASPTKPPGILLTPGTGPSRRKTVSFEPTLDRHEEESGGLTDRRQGGLHAGNPSGALMDGEGASSGERTMTSLTRALYESRSSGANESNASLSGRASATGKSHREQPDSRSQLIR